MLLYTIRKARFRILFKQLFRCLVQSNHTRGQNPNCESLKAFMIDPLWSCVIKEEIQVKVPKSFCYRIRKHSNHNLALFLLL